MVKLSFILPCYNVAPYVGRCIESIERQDIPREEYEVICVDDCSKDNTVEVIKEYQKQYHNIRLICHVVNKTAGGARNTAIEAAKGEYIWCVDPDDSVQANVLLKLLNKAESLSLDMLLFNLMLRDENGREHKSIKYQEYDEAATGIDYVLTQCANYNYLYHVAGHTCSLYRREFLKRNNVHYPEIRSSQDVIFIWYAILKAERVSSSDIACYNIIRRPDSTTGSKGKLRANAIISTTLLFANEVNKLRPLNNEICIEKNLLYVMRLTLDDDSRMILKTTFYEQRLFYREICSYAAMIDQYEYLMNRKTKMIFNYHLPYVVWQMMIWGYMIVGKRKG